MLANILYFTVSICLGAILGSFYGAMWTRRNEPKTVQTLRRVSSCDSCHTPILARDNIPIFSYLQLRGKSRCCRQSIDPAQFVSELALCSLMLILAIDAQTFNEYLLSLMSVAGVGALGLWILKSMKRLK